MDRTRFSKLETTCENPAFSEDLCLRAKIRRAINKRDMNLNVMFHVLIRVYVSTFETFYLTTFISAALCYWLYSFKPCSLFFATAKYLMYLACILVIKLITAHADVT